MAAEKEKEEVIRQKKELFYSRREKQTQLENLEKRMEVAEMVWFNGIQWHIIGGSEIYYIDLPF